MSYHLFVDRGCVPPPFLSCCHPTPAWSPNSPSLYLAHKPTSQLLDQPSGNNNRLHSVMNYHQAIDRACGMSYLYTCSCLDKPSLGRRDITSSFCLVVISGLHIRLGLRSLVLKCFGKRPWASVFVLFFRCLSSVMTSSVLACGGL